MKVSFNMQSTQQPAPPGGQTATREALEAALLLVHQHLQPAIWGQLMAEMKTRMGLEFVARIEQQAVRKKG